ncbi:MAG: hypothetical protein WDO68_16585 [Gammaproteobacteria bacterium]
MNAKAWPLILTLCLVGCTGEKPRGNVPVQSQDLDGVMYKRGDGRDAIQCHAGPVPSDCGPVNPLEMPIIFDCSDEQFECVFNSADVMAVPRAGLTLGQKYTAFGANLTVEQCIGAEGSCEIAVIRSECADAQICSCRSPFPGRTTAFSFSREKGILTFHSVVDPAAAGLDPKVLPDVIPLLTYFLVAKKGFFRTPVALEKATLVTDCRK